jgi:hypothetical protein
MFPRGVSFFHTQPQIKAQTKTVTRRLGWKFLKPGDILSACEKCQGLGKGEKIKKICRIKVVGVRREPLSAITAEDVALEGFPAMSPVQFIEFFCGAMGCTPKTIVTRIDFEFKD